MTNNEKQHSNQKSQLSEVFYRKMAAVLFAATMYLMILVADDFEEISAPWNYIAALTLAICNGLLTLYFFGDPEKEDEK